MKNLSRPSSVIPLVLGMLSGLSRKEDRPAVIPSHKIESEKETKYEWPKRTQQKMKGKKNRMNRGRNRQKKRTQDTALYAMIRR